MTSPTDENTIIALQKHSSDGGYTDIEIQSGENFHAIVEAKRSWELPSRAQLQRYRPRLAAHGAAIQRLALLTGCRSSEVAGINRAELLELEAAGKAAWLLPQERSKNGRSHFVPLSELARATVLSALELISDDDDFVFPSPIETGGPITGHALTVAMRRLSQKIDGSALKTWRVDPPSPHDLRRTVATRLSQLGTPPEDVAAILNHVRSDVTGRHYDLYQRAAEKRAALDQWADRLSSIVSPGASA
jgi:integrase